MNVTALDIARRFVGIEEVSGKTANPMILAMLRLDSRWPEDDSVPWCSGFCSFVAWLLALPRSTSLAARSWLRVGVPVELADAVAGYDVVILKRGGAGQPGPEVTAAPGHVGFYSGRDGKFVLVLGGNQSDSVSVARFNEDLVLGVRRLWHPSGV